MPEEKKIQIFQSDDGEVQLDVSLQLETVWLSQTQMCELFGRERSVITKHINNVFKEGELERDSVCAKFAHTADDGKTYNIQRFNLDVIISVGYRVKSTRGVQFRQWSTKILKQHLVQGYSLNQQRLAERGIEFEQVVQLLSQTLAANKENQALEDLRNTLLPKLLSGALPLHPNQTELEQAA
jgi:hypothetical protein